MRSEIPQEKKTYFGKWRRLVNLNFVIFLQNNTKKSQKYTKIVISSQTRSDISLCLPNKTTKHTFFDYFLTRYRWFLSISVNTDSKYVMWNGTCLVNLVFSFARLNAGLGINFSFCNLRKTEYFQFWLSCCSFCFFEGEKNVDCFFFVVLFKPTSYI